MKPLNGKRTHPLSEHALSEMRDMSNGPVPRQSVNPGVADRLLRGDLVELTLLPSPFRTHAGKRIEHLRLTKAGFDLAVNGRPPNGALSDLP